MQSLGAPLIGNTKFTLPFKASNKSFISLTKIEFVHPSTSKKICIEVEEPHRFEQLRIKE